MAFKLETGTTFLTCKFAELDLLLQCWVAFDLYTRVRCSSIPQRGQAKPWRSSSIHFASARFVSFPDFRLWGGSAEEGGLWWFCFRSVSSAKQCLQSKPEPM